MKFMKNLEAYFNTGSVEKQNQKRLGGIIIGVTAVLLVVSMLVLGIGSIVGAITDAINEKQENEENNAPVVNTDLVDSTLDAIVALDNGYLLNTSNSVSVSLSAKDYTRLQRPNRPVASDGETKLYGCESADFFALQNAAFAKFNEMISDFYAEKGLTTLWVKEAYNTNIENNAAAFANALAVRLNYVTDADTLANATIFGVDEYEWLYKNAYKYGFVQATNEEGNENIFRYVGLDHAKQIESKNTTKKFYGVNDYLADLKNYTTGKLTIRSVATEIAEGKTKKINHFVYFVPASGPYKLPDEKEFNYTVSSNNTDGYIITYWEKA